MFRHFIPPDLTKYSIVIALSQPPIYLHHRPYQEFPLEQHEDLKEKMRSLNKKIRAAREGTGNP